MFVKFRHVSLSSKIVVKAVDENGWGMMLKWNGNGDTMNGDAGGH